MILSERISPKYSNLLTAIATALIVLGTFNSIFSLAALFVCVFNILISNEESSMSMLMFLLPFSNIFKLSPTSQSFFTYITLFYVLYMLLVKRNINRKFLVFLFALISVILLQAFISFNLLRFIKLVANVFIVYFAMNLNPENGHKRIFLSFVLGVIVSSLLSFPGVLSNLSDYVPVKDLGLANDWLVRFAGMYGDPNYYSVNVITSICILVLMWHKREINPFVAAGLAALLVYFAVITYSKSAFLMLALPLLLFLHSNIKNRKYFWSAVFSIGAVCLVVMVFAGRISALDMVLSRFTGGSGDITTGRTALWKNYLTVFAENPLLLLLGRGLNAELVGGMAAHNTYIDFLYFFGLSGTIIFLLILAAIPKQKMKDKKRNVFNYSLFACIGIMYFFLSETFYVDFPFHIIIAFVAYNLSLDKNKNGNLR